MLTRVLSVKAAAVAGVLAFSATGAAAASGHLPASAQDVAHDVFSTVGVAVPTAETDKPEAPETETETDDPAESTSTTGSVTSTTGGAGSTTSTTTKVTGLCRALVASDGHPDEHSRVAGVDPATCPPGTGRDDGGAGEQNGDHQGDHQGDQGDQGDHQGGDPTGPTTTEADQGDHGSHGDHGPGVSTPTTVGSHDGGGDTSTTSSNGHSSGHGGSSGS